jgi:glycine dehydrogenase subunit 2
MKRIDRSNKVRTGFHQAKWDEPVIFELSQKGERGVLVPQASKAVKDAVGDVIAKLPSALQRKTPPALPEVSQPRVLRHYMRLSQQTLGADVNI